jgi:D-glutamate cyclase
MPDLMGEQVDRLITIELKNRGMPHGFLRALYEAARDEGGGRPLTTRAAEGLKQHVGEGDRVLILTGAGYPPVMPQGESDGPPGAAVLARMLYWGLGAVPLYVCEPMHVEPIVASSEAADVMIFPPEHAIGRRHGGALLASPTDQGAVEAWAREIFDRFEPKAIVANEKLGRAADGKVYNATGQVKGKDTGITDLSPVMEEATRRGIFSIGIGDHGNEVGFGRIQDAVHRLMPAGKVNCTVVPTDVLLPCMMSNWGCYGIAAVLAFLLGRADLVHGPAQEERIVRACLEAGGLEAMMCTRRFIVDGAEGESGMAVVQLLGDMVRLALSPPSRGVAH